ncbi:antigen WC1.1-like [Strix uralensis]|uniref:antigen WC1.1-like n=1 Tax=Strix uralensis TaxID=36305 RepID=UPI003DA725E6
MLPVPPMAVASLLSPGSVSFGSLRLVGGGSRCDGRVEIFQDGAWGRVLDDQWDVQEASVVCRQLRWHEANLSLCNTSLPETTLAAVVVEDKLLSGTAQLGPGGSTTAGTKRMRESSAQVFYNGTWGSVCSNSMTLNTVMLVCKELSCGDGGSLERRQPSGGRPEMPLAPLAPCPNSTSCTAREKIRAVGGEDECSGRVEVWHRGSWGTVCDDSWDIQDAEVACRQLGCGRAVSALREAVFGMGMGPIWLEQVECQGTELSLQDCWARPGDSGACRHKEDAAVRCSATPRMATSPPQAVPTRGRQTSSGRVSVPVIICIILGALLCLLLALLAGQVLSTRAARRGSRRAQESFLEAVYEEIGYSPALEKQARFGHSAWGLWESIQVLGPREKLSPSQL